GVSALPAVSAKKRERLRTEPFVVIQRVLVHPRESCTVGADCFSTHCRAAKSRAGVVRVAVTVRVIAAKAHSELEILRESDVGSKVAEHACVAETVADLSRQRNGIGRRRRVE